MADNKIDQLKIGSTSYDIDLPPDATPSIASLTVSGAISEGGTSLVNKYLGKSAKSADSDKLDGNDSAYYLNYNNLTNTPSISNATVTVKQTGQTDQTFTLNGSAATINLADTNTWRPIGTGAEEAAAGNHTHGNITNAGTITSTVVTSATGVLVYDSNNKIQRATAAQTRSIMGAGTSNFSGSYNDLTNKPTIPATNVIPTTTTANKVLISTTTSGTAKWSDFSSAGFLKTNTSGVVSVDTTSYLPLSGGSLTGELKLYTENGDSPRLTFQRGTLTDSYNDWSLYDTGGHLHIQQRGSASTGWEDRATFTQQGVNFAETISEGGTSLAKKYLGISAKAADADKLDGQDSTYYLNYNNLTGTPIPGDSGEIKTKYRCSVKGYTGADSTAWYYKLCTLPKSNSGNYASVIISGRLGGWTAGNLSSVYCLGWNRDSCGFALMDLGGAGTMASIFARGDLVMYTDADDDNKVAVYVKVTGYFTFDLNVELYQSTAVLDFDGTYVTSPSGTLEASASTSTSRVQLEQGVLKVNGTAVQSKISALGAATKPVYFSSDGVASVCSTYAGGTAVTLNGTSKAASTASFYAPTSVGTNGQLLSSNGSSLVWTNDNRSLLHHNLGVIIENTTTDKGWKMFTDDPENDPINGFFLKSVRFNAQSPSWGVGNFGAGVVFGGGDTKGVVSVAYGTPDIKIAGGNGSGPRWWVGLTGTSATTYDLDELKDKQDKISSLGTDIKPIYFSSDGVISACLNYAGGTKITLNNTEHKGTTASFYAPTTGGTSGYSLKSNGSGNAPRWANSRSATISGTISTGVKTCTAASFMITSSGTDHELGKGIWYYVGTYGTFIVFVPYAITTPYSSKTVYITGYVSSQMSGGSITLVEL